MRPARLARRELPAPRRPQPSHACCAGWEELKEALVGRRSEAQIGWQCTVNDARGAAGRRGQRLSLCRNNG